MGDECDQRKAFQLFFSITSSSGPRNWVGEVKEYEIYKAIFVVTLFLIFFHRIKGGIPPPPPPHPTSPGCTIGVALNVARFLLGKPTLAAFLIFLCAALYVKLNCLVVNCLKSFCSLSYREVRKELFVRL